MPHRPLVALEVSALPSEKTPPTIVDIFGKDLLNDPVELAKVCVDKYGADLISVSLLGTHPEKGNMSADDAVKVVGNILQAVDVPLIITGHTHYDKTNEVMKAVAQTFAGENLLLNWVEQDNYKTIAGVAMAYGHSLVAQSPIDVNIAKQMVILLTNMDFPKGNIVIDPTTSAMGYGIEYTYSVMERIRVTGIDGEAMLCAPLIVSPGPETGKIKEAKASGADFPAWGKLEDRIAALEFGAAQSYLYAGANVLIMSHPEAALQIRKTIDDLLDGKRG
jgi:acetyl-CoA decarbonylase/synthase complex subunit delta